MMRITLKNQFNISSGEIIKGKWHKKKYKVKKELGRGANGVVFLAESNGKEVAIKMSDHYASIISEVNVLKNFAKVQGITLGPSLLDVDDWESRGQQISFYVMEYIHGTNLLTFIQRNGHSWLDVLIIQLLNHLELLHKNGWIFGDLKPENLIITESPVQLRCIDVGGTTIQGRAIKEYTEFFDRGYWGLGSRKAEPSYDLFSVSMIMINMYYPQRFPKKNGGIEQLKQAIQQKGELKKYEPLLIHSLTGKYRSAGEMKRDLLQLVNQPTYKNNSSVYRQKRRNPSITNRRQKHQQQKKSSIFETIMIILLVLTFYAVYIYQQIL